MSLRPSVAQPPRSGPWQRYLTGLHNQGSFTTDLEHLFIGLAGASR